jgi:hypothetical protein
MTKPTPAAVLNARYIAIRTAEAAGLTDRLVQACRDKDPAVRRMLVPMLFRFWHRDRDRGWALLEQIEQRVVRFGVVLDIGAISVLGAVSLAILNESRQQPNDLARLGAFWSGLTDRVLGSPLARGVRLVGRGLVLRKLVGMLADRVKNQPNYQPLNYNELVASFARPAEFRQKWARVLTCLEQPDTAPGPIVEVLSEPRLPFDLYLMLVCERALIYYGVKTDPAAMMDTAEHLFQNGARWFRQSILYVLLHVLEAWGSPDEETLDRYEALTFEFYRAGDWQLDTSVEHYVFANQLANVDAIVARRGGRTPHVVGDMLDSAIADNDVAAINALFDGIDGVAFYHDDGALALTMLERAYISGSAAVEDRVVESLASVRLQNQQLVDAFLQQHISFTRIRAEQVATAEPSVGDEDFNTLIDKFFIQTMLASADFRAQFCRVLKEILTLRTAEECLVLIVEWFRDELVNLTASPTPTTAPGDTG